ncbi:hypothetical protein BKA70DRAFT_1424009 [Coprinopsis sp. MPI-PUGE-AT-0042]|nr:hypothetical protein BKA70DRAFT_1424009 [Coprinopsis sp. MPI-PUGE-AT-0042]
MFTCGHHCKILSATSASSIELSWEGSMGLMTEEDHSMHRRSFVFPGLGGKIFETGANYLDATVGSPSGSMISGGRVRRLSAGSPIEASPCVRIEKRCPRQLRRATARMVYQGTQLVRIAVNGNEVRDSTVGGKLHNIVEKPSIVSTLSMSFDDNYVANAAPQLVDPMHLQPHAAGPRPSRASRDERSLPQSWKHEDSNWKYQTHIRALAKIRGIKEYTIPDSDFNNSHGEMVHRELRKLMGHERKAQKHLAATPEVKLEGIKGQSNLSNQDRIFGHSVSFRNVQVIFGNVKSSSIIRINPIWENPKLRHHPDVVVTVIDLRNMQRGQPASHIYNPRTSGKHIAVPRGGSNFLNLPFGPVIASWSSDHPIAALHATHQSRSDILGLRF